MKLSFRFSTYLIVALILFTIINPLSGWDILAFISIAFILLHKIFGDYVLLVLLAIRPALDYWRDYTLISIGNVAFNINAGLAVLLLAWSVFFLLKNYRRGEILPLALPWLAFIGWCALSLLYSYDAPATITETIKATNLFTLFAISCLLYRRDGEKYRKYFLRALLLGAILPLGLAIYQLIVGAGLTIDGVPNRIYGSFAHPNILATFALLLFVALAGETLRRQRNFFTSRPLAPIAGLITLALIIAFTYTRIVWIGLFLFLLIVGLARYRRPTLYALAGVALFYLLFYPINGMLKNNYNVNLQAIPFIARLTARSAEADSIAWRADVASKVLPLFYRRPLLGFGYGSFTKVWNDSKGAANIWDNTSEAHNDYLKIGFEAGLVGLGLFLLIFFQLFWSQLRYGRAHRWTNIVFLASIFIYLVMSLSDNLLHHTAVIWWLWALWGMWTAEHHSQAR